MLRYRLRTLLLVTLILGGGLGWWFRPFTMQKRWVDGNLKSEFHVRRTWNGELVTSGRQRWWWRNGQLAITGISYGETGKGSPIDLKEAHAFSPDGSPKQYDGEFYRKYIFATSWRSGYRKQTSPVLEWPSDIAFPETPHESDDRVYAVP